MYFVRLEVYSTLLHRNSSTYFKAGDLTFELRTWYRVHKPAPHLRSRCMQICVLTRVTSVVLSARATSYLIWCSVHPPQSTFFPASKFKSFLLYKVIIDGNCFFTPFPRKYFVLRRQHHVQSFSIDCSASIMWRSKLINNPIVWQGSMLLWESPQTTVSSCNISPRPALQMEGVRCGVPFLHSSDSHHVHELQASPIIFDARQSCVLDELDNQPPCLEAFSTS